MEQKKFIGGIGISAFFAFVIVWLAGTRHDGFDRSAWWALPAMAAISAMTFWAIFSRDNSATSILGATAGGGGRAVTYKDVIRVNIWSVIPVIAVVVVIAATRLSLVIPADCPTSKSNIFANPVFCPKSTNALAFFGEIKTAAQKINNAAPDVAAQALAYREARARLTWVASFGVELAAAVGSILIGLWVTAIAVEDMWFKGQPAGAPPQAANGLFSNGRVSRGTPHRFLLGIMTLSALVALSIHFLLLCGGSKILYGTMLPEEQGEQQFILTFTDTAVAWLVQNLANVKPLAHLVDTIDAMAALGLIALATAITAILYDDPTQAEARVSPGPDRETEQSLYRCFQRLTGCTYVGAVLLAACTAQIGARYAWPGALFGDNTSPISKAFGDLSAEFSLAYGLAFTMILAAMLVPAWAILHRRAWEVAISSNPADSRAADLQDWLVKGQLTFTASDQVKQLIAVLAPTGVGAATVFLKLF